MRVCGDAEAVVYRYVIVSNSDSVIFTLSNLCGWMAVSPTVGHATRDITTTTGNSLWIACGARVNLSESLLKINCGQVRALPT